MSVVTDPIASSSAKAIIDGALGQYGLSSLSSWAWSKWQAGESTDQIMLELRDTSEYQARFPAMKTLASRGQAISESQYINYEQSAAQMFQAAGLPQNFYDTPDDIAKLLTNNVALPELQQRLQTYQTAAFQSPPEVRDELQRLYGVSPGELTAFFIDPDKALPLIQSRFASAQAAGYSDTTGFGQLTQAQAEQIGAQGLSSAQVQQGFGQLAAQKALFNPLTGQNEAQIGNDVALGATFGQNAQDQAIIEQRKAQRLATFQAGGQVATSQTGAAGAGAAQ